MPSPVKAVSVLFSPGERTTKDGQVPAVETLISRVYLMSSIVGLKQRAGPPAPLKPHSHRLAVCTFFDATIHT